MSKSLNRDVAVVMSSGGEFHNLAAMTGKARSVAKRGVVSCSRNNQSCSRCEHSLCWLSGTMVRASFYTDVCGWLSVVQVWWRRGLPVQEERSHRAELWWHWWRHQCSTIDQRLHAGLHTPVTYQYVASPSVIENASMWCRVSRTNQICQVVACSSG